MPYVPIGELMRNESISVDPRRYEDETFDLYSIPAYDNGTAEVIRGKSIGSAKQIVEPNDILLSRIVPHIRRAWVVGPRNGHRQIASGEWIVFRDNRADPDYLRHVVVGDEFHSAFMMTVAGVGGSLMRARPNHVAQIQVPLPPLPEQRRIAAILDQADALRAKRRAALAQLDEMAQAIFVEMVAHTNDVVDFPALVNFKEGPGVRNWQFRDSGIKLLNVGNITKGVLKTSTTARYLDPAEVSAKYSHFLLQESDLVLASSGVTWGKIAEVSSTHLPLCLNTSTIRLRPSSKAVTKEYIRGFVEYGTFKEQIGRLITGSAQPNFGPSHLKQVKIPVVPLPAQVRFVKASVQLSNLRSLGFKAERLSDEFFASLQHRAFRGEL